MKQINVLLFPDTLRAFLLCLWFIRKSFRFLLDQFVSLILKIDVIDPSLISRVITLV